MVKVFFKRAPSELYEIAHGKIIPVGGFNYIINALDKVNAVKWPDRPIVDVFKNTFKIYIGCYGRQYTESLIEQASLYSHIEMKFYVELMDV